MKKAGSYSGGETALWVMTFHKVKLLAGPNPPVIFKCPECGGDVATTRVIRSILRTGNGAWRDTEVNAIVTCSGAYEEHYANWEICFSTVDLKEGQALH